jgi:hypothetical protein
VERDSGNLYCTGPVDRERYESFEVKFMNCVMNCKLRHFVPRSQFIYYFLFSESVTDVLAITDSILLT